MVMINFGYAFYPGLKTIFSITGSVSGGITF
jgi:hypothetical protein